MFALILTVTIYSNEVTTTDYYIEDVTHNMTDCQTSAKMLLSNKDYLKAGYKLSCKKMK